MDHKNEFSSVREIAGLWGVSERTIRNYAKEGKIPGAFLTGKTWNIPSDAQKPHSGKRDLLSVLQYEMNTDYKGGIYHKVQVDLTYNSNHIEGSRLSHDQTRYIYETRTLSADDGTVFIDDIAETINHFSCVRMIIDKARCRLSENFIKELHKILKNGTADSMKSWFRIGDYKKLPNTVGGIETTEPSKVAAEMKKLIAGYEALSVKTLEDIVSFHAAFEKIHPFQDGNGRIGRLIMFKECLRTGIVPFIIDEEMKKFYYRGLAEWGHINEYLLDTCRFSQDNMEKALDYFRIDY